MQARELFIYNETYPLPLDKYAEFKSRSDGCAGNPMCINRLKYDAETFIADFGKKHGTKIETGEESGFTILNESHFTLNKTSSSATEVKEPKSIGTLAVIGILFALGILCVVQRNVTVGVAAIMLAIFLFIKK